MVIKEYVGDKGELLAYAWPGGYPILYLDRDGEDLCPACANKERKNVLEGYVHWEGRAVICAACNATIESAYGEEEEPKDTQAWVWDMWEAMATSAKAKETR